MSNAKTLHLQFADGEIEVGTLIDALYEQERTIAILRQHKTDYMEAAEGTRKALEAECERLRMQLAACGVVALANTPESAAQARQMHSDYMSASCSDVADAVDREMTLRQQRDALAAELAAIKGQEVDGGN